MSEHIGIQICISPINLSDELAFIK